MRGADRKRCLWALAAALLAGTPAQAYYHYVHYLNGNFASPVYEKFDLTALPNKTVTFFVVDSGPRSFGANDDFSSVLSQVQQAALAWNSVDSSDLRVAFGGLESQNQAQNTPGGDVVFADLQPGLLGLGGTSVPVSESPVAGASGTFFPIVRSIIELTNNTGAAPGPSYLESYFTTAVHEMGHALGLQHTWTSAAMAQDVIRNTSRARPIDADDRAALSVLYGKANWAAGYGSISGRVTANGQPVALASVVAIAPTGPAVSALTNPDGTYTISGLPPNSYLLYVHPLPPDAILANGAGLLPPVDQNGNKLAASGPFFTSFLQGSASSGPASFSISAGSSLTGQNFAVTAENAVSLYDVVTSSYSAAAGSWNTPAFANTAGSAFTIRAYTNYQQTPTPQSVTILGGFGNAPICAASGSATAIQSASLPCFQPYDSNTGAYLPGNNNNPAAVLAIYFNVPPGIGTGPRHLLFTMPNGDLYVLPDGVNLVVKNPPAIASVTQNSDGDVTVSGSNFGPDSRVFFDGQPALVDTAFSGTAAQGSISVIPPPGFGGQTATVIVYNSDGQNSTFYQSQTPPTYLYPANGTPQITVNPASLAPGVSSMVDITAANMQFVNGQVTVGLGTSDVTVRRVWVLSPTHLVANMVAASNAAIGASEISVVSGFQMAVQPGAFQIQPPNAFLPWVALPILNNDPSQTAIYPGANVSIYGSRLSTGPNTTQVTLSGVPMQVLFSSPTQVNFVVPSNWFPGLSQLIVNNGSASSPALELEIDNPPAVIQQVAEALGQALDSSHAAAAGDVLTVTVSNIDPTVVASPGRIQVTLSGLPMNVLQVASGSQKGTVTISFVVSQSFGGATVPLIVTVDGAPSSPFPVTLR